MNHPDWLAPVCSVPPPRGLEMSPFNSLSDNPLLTRDDVVRALHSLFTPLLPCFSAGGARVRIDAAGAVFDPVAAELEGFARPLWGLAAAALGGDASPDIWALYRRGLACGVDPGHPEYWGDTGPVDQRMVELAAIAFALRVAPDYLWEPLAPREKALVRVYLLGARAQPFSNNNWKFFRLILDLGLQEIGVPVEQEGHRQTLDEIDAFHLGDGWYCDGPTSQVDHYIAFAFQFYGLLYATLSKGDAVHNARFAARATAFAPAFAHWFDDAGAALPIGRSLTYRFAAAAYWGALAFANIEALPWGVIKGYYLRHLRWWSRQPIMRRDHLLTLGYAYPNAGIVEDYSSAQSPYWAFKAFLPLALPADHPFWLAQEVPAERDGAIVALPAPGLLIRHEPRNTTALASGQANPTIRFGAEKYAKFAYSTRYAFSVEGDLRAFDRMTLDGMIGFGDTGGPVGVRQSCEMMAAPPGILRSRWRPRDDIAVETWLWWQGPWQMRLHCIDTPHALETIEGGAAVCRDETWRDAPAIGTSTGVALEGASDFSGIVTASESGRRARILACQPNTHLLHPRTLVPQLLGSIAPGRSRLFCAVLATTDALAPTVWQAPPDLSPSRATSILDAQ